MGLAEEEQAIRSVVASWIDATQRGDIDAVLALMTEDALFLVPGQPPMSKAGFEAASRAQAGAGLRIAAQSEVIEVGIDGQLAYMWSRLAVQITAPGSGIRSREGHTLTVFRKVGGRWLLHRDANLLAASGSADG